MPNISAPDPVYLAGPLQCPHRKTILNPLLLYHLKKVTYCDFNKKAITIFVSIGKDFKINNITIEKA